MRFLLADRANMGAFAGAARVTRTPGMHAAC